MEQNLWRGEICGGTWIDLSQRDPSERQLSAQFLQDILSQSPWREVTERTGLFIFGALFPERVELKRFSVKRDLWLESSVFEHGLILSEGDISGSLSLEHSSFGGQDKPDDLLLANVRIGNNLYMGELLAGRIQLLSSQIKGNLFAIRKGRDEAHSNRLYLQGTVVGSEVVIESEAIDDLVLNESEVGKGFKIAKATGQPNPTFRSIQLTGAKIGNGLHLDSVESNTVLAELSKIGGSFEIGGGRLKTLSLRSSKVDGWIRLRNDRAKKPLHWVDGGKAELLDVEVRAIATNDLWPASLRVEDLRLGRVQETADDQEQDDRDCGEDCATDAIIGWLQRTTTVAIEPYQIVADLVRKKGEDQQATRILIAGWDRKRHHAGWMEWWWLTLEKLATQYGYQPSRLLIWTVLLVLLGRIVLRSSEIARQKGFNVWYSIDLLLPAIKLREAHFKEELEPRIQGYFYIHRLMGWLLASFLLAALSRLAK